MESNYSLRKQIETSHIDYGKEKYISWSVNERLINSITIQHLCVRNNADDEDITPYATFTLKPICGMDTNRSLMSVPSIRGPDSHSSNSIEGKKLSNCTRKMKKKK